MTWALFWEWLIKSLILIFTLLTGFAYTTYYERRWIARIQVRVGPNRAGPAGLLQPIADAVKLIFKEELTPGKVYKLIFFLSPIITMVPSLVIAAVIPWGTSFQLNGQTIYVRLVDLNVGALYLMSVASIAVYGIVLAGWSSNNKYAMMGGLRSSAQMISYELTLGLGFVTAILLTGSMSMVDIVNGQREWWFVCIQPVGFLLFFIATLAEVNRAPFDMPEAEQELTAGYHTEYSGMKFALFFMAEYQKMIVVSMISATLFLGGFLGPGVDKFWFLGPLYLFGKVFILLGVMIWIRASWPRIRYDRLMAFGWKVMIPLSLATVFITATGILIESSWFILIASLVAAAIAVVAVYVALRRKAYEFA
jgi:NADH-quinone oxidoreductase subunit H